MLRQSKSIVRHSHTVGGANEIQTDQVKTVYTVAVDVGGTFTDLVVADGEQPINLFKAPTVPDSPVEGVLNALELAAKHYEKPLREFLGQTGALSHGTTVATNAVLTGDTAKTGLLINKGYEDLLAIGLGSKGKSAEDMFRSHMAYPEPFIPRYLTVGVEGRINAEGGVETPLDEEGVRAGVRQLRNWNVESIAISVLWSPVNPEHERRIAEILVEEYPGITYSLGSEVNPVIREYERTSTTAIDAALKPHFSRYALGLAAALSSNGYGGDLLMINSNGGVMKADELAALPIYAIKSGPSIGPSAGLALSIREELGSNVLVCDMGGTSFDASLVTEGRVASTSDNQVGNYHYNVSCVEVNSIGAGGGSIARVDPGGLVHVGPASAGAAPGPACYGLGGEEPTVTDADVVLGYLNPDYFLGGTMNIQAKLSEQSIRTKLADPLGMDVVQAASLVYAVVNQSMVKGLEEVSIRRGIDPREYLLVAGGGAGAVHVIPIAQEIGIGKILIPRMAAGLCAYGMLFGDVIFQRARGLVTRSVAFDFDRVNSALSALEEEGESFLSRAGIPPDMRRLEFSMAMRYPYQAWEIDVLLPWNRVTTERLPQLVELFHETHDSRYGFRVDNPAECASLMVKAVGIRPPLRLAEENGGGSNVKAAVKGQRPVYFIQARDFVDTTIYAGEQLRSGDIIAGPAIVEEPQTTVVIPEDYQATVTHLGNYLLEAR